MKISASALVVLNEINRLQSTERIISYSYLADATGQGRRTIDRRIRELRAAKLIELIRPGSTHFYQINLLPAGREVLNTWLQ